MLRCALLPLLSLAMTACSGGGTGERPNVLIVAVDTLRADHLGAHGYSRPTSPAIDALLASSVTFEDAHSTSSWTLPAFASLWTSQHSSTHGCWQFDHALHPSFSTLAEVLAEHGWWTEGIVSHVFLGSRHGLHQGFQRYDEELVHETLLASHLAISSPELTEKALAFLDSVAADGARRAPWMLFVHYFDPHDVYRYHEGITGAFGDEPADHYDGEIAFTDRHVGAVLDRLEAHGLAEDTIVVFLSDHGEELGDHGGWGHGASLYREVERVPLALRVPGLPPRRVEEPVSIVDVMPTLLDLLAIEVDVPLAGTSLVGLMTGDAATRDGGGLLLESRLDKRQDADLAAWVDGTWKLIVETPKPGAARGEEVMLFDRARDPREREDRAAERPELAADLRGELEAAVSAAVRQAESFLPSERIGLTEAERARLAQLGYAGGGRAPAPRSGAAAVTVGSDRVELVMTALAGATRREVVKEWDEHGFLRATPLPPEPRGPVVLALGDSHLDGVVPVEENLTALLEAALRQDPGGGLRVLNAARHLFSPLQYVQRARELVPRWEPEVVLVLLYAGNDFLDLEKAHFPHLDDALVERPAAAEERGEVEPPKGMELRQGLAQSRWLEQHPERIPIIRRKAARAVELLEEVAAAGDARILWVLLPSFDLVFPDLVAEMDIEEEGFVSGAAQQDLYDWFRDLLETRGARVVDMLPVLREDGSLDIYATDLHLFVRGHRLVAETVLPELREMLR